MDGCVAQRAVFASIGRTLAWIGIALAACGASLQIAHSVRVALRPRDLRAVLVDSSASVLHGRLDWREKATGLLLEEARDAQSRQQDLLIVVFDTDVRRCYGPAPADTFLAQPLVLAPNWKSRRQGDKVEVVACIVPFGTGDRTCLAEALELVVAEVEGRAGEAEIVLLSDRTFTGSDPHPVLERLAERGAALRWLDLPEPTDPTWHLGEIDAPPAVEVGAPLEIAFELFVRPGGKPSAVLKVPIEIHCESAEVIQDERFEVPAQDQRVLDASGYARLIVRRQVGRAVSGLNEIAISLAHGHIANPAALALQRHVSVRGGLADGPVLEMPLEDHRLPEFVFPRPQVAVQTQAVPRPQAESEAGQPRTADSWSPWGIWVSLAALLSFSVGTIVLRSSRSLDA